MRENACHQTLQKHDSQHNKHRSYTNPPEPTSYEHMLSASYFGYLANPPCLQHARRQTDFHTSHNTKPFIYIYIFFRLLLLLKWFCVCCVCSQVCHRERPEPVGVRLPGNGGSGRARYEIQNVCALALRASNSTIAIGIHSLDAAKADGLPALAVLNHLQWARLLTAIPGEMPNLAADKALALGLAPGVAAGNLGPCGLSCRNSRTTYPSRLLAGAAAQRQQLGNRHLPGPRL